MPNPNPVRVESFVRPKHYKTPEALADAVVTYFEENPKGPYTTAGLARALGFRSRSSLQDYRVYEGYGPVIDWAMLRIEEGYELRLHGNNPTGAIFALKNFGWSDRQEIEHSGNVGLDLKAVRDKVESRIAGMATRLVSSGE